jgi:dTDP-4-dehydrorhamnose reductase
MAAGCLETGARLVYVSTDYVLMAKNSNPIGNLIQ